MSSDKLTLIDEFLIKDFNACGETGDKASNKLKQLRRILLEQILIKIGKITPEKAQKIINVFSIQHQFENRVQCYVDGNYFGENPKIVKFNDLHLEEQNDVKEYISSLLASIRDFAKVGLDKNLLQSSSNSLKFFYSPKKTDYNQCGAALIFPGFDFVYMINDQPVILMWAFEKADLNIDFQKELAFLFTEVAQKPMLRVEDNQDAQSSTSMFNSNDSVDSVNVRNSSNAVVSESDTVYPIIEEYRPKTQSSYSTGNQGQYYNYDSSSSNYENDDSVDNNETQSQSEPQSQTQDENVQTNTENPLDKNTVAYMHHNGHSHQSVKEIERIEERVIKEKAWDWKVWLLILLSILFFILLIVLIWYLFFYLENEKVKDAAIAKTSETELVADSLSSKQNVVTESLPTEPQTNNFNITLDTPTSLQNEADKGLSLDETTKGVNGLSGSELSSPSGSTSSSNSGSNLDSNSMSENSPITSDLSTKSDKVDNLDSSNNKAELEQGNNKDELSKSSSSKEPNEASNEATKANGEEQNQATPKSDIEVKDDKIPQENSSTSKQAQDKANSPEEPNASEKTNAKAESNSSEDSDDINQTFKDEGKAFVKFVEEPNSKETPKSNEVLESNEAPKSNEDLKASNNLAKKKQLQKNDANNELNDDKQTLKANVNRGQDVKEKPIDVQKPQTKVKSNASSNEFPVSGIKLHNKDLSLKKNVAHDNVSISAYDTKKKNFVCSFQGNVIRTQGVEDYHLSTSSSLCKSLNIEKITCKGSACIINGNPGQRVELFE
jgi:hypothetical protein